MKSGDHPGTINGAMNLVRGLCDSLAGDVVTLYRGTKTPEGGKGGFGWWWSEDIDYAIKHAKEGGDLYQVNVPREKLRGQEIPHGEVKNYVIYGNQHYNPSSVQKVAPRPVPGQVFRLTPITEGGDLSKASETGRSSELLETPKIENILPSVPHPKEDE